MIGRVRALFGRAEALRYKWLAREEARIERVLGLELWIPSTVLGVASFRAGALLAREAAGAGRLLDMGCGSGVVGIFAARSGAVVTAVDLNPVAVRATIVNAMLNGVSVDARSGDLFAPLADRERFDVVAFNPPFFESVLEDGHPLAMAMSGGIGLPLLERFLAGARDFVAPAGRILIAGSTNGALGRMRAMYEAHGFRWRTTRAKERISERLVIDELT